MNNDIWKGFMKEVNTYLKNPNDKAKEESFNKIQKIVEEQKRIILTLDSKDIEHVYLYSSKKWNEFYKLSINEIINGLIFLYIKYFLYNNPSTITTNNSNIYNTIYDSLYPI